ncbi:MAG: Ig-like domain-containing protein [Synergistaceae bacterium]|nr:Ig-like domain-containing protein [Synergistaceae bacterium]
MRKLRRRLNIHGKNRKGLPTFGNRRRPILLLFCALLLSPLSAYAETQNWNNNNPPTVVSGDIVAIANTPSGTLSIPDNSIVTITGTATSNVNGIILEIGDGATVKWEAKLTGSASQVITLSNDISGTGAFEVLSGDIANGVDTAIVSKASNKTTVKVSGGTVKSTGSGGKAISTGSGNVEVSGGTVESTAAGGKAIATISGNVKISGGSVVAAGGSAIFISQAGSVEVSGGLVQGAGTTISVSSGTIEVKGGTIQASGVDAKAISTTGPTTIVIGDKASISGSTPALYAVSFDVSPKGTASSATITAAYNNVPIQSKSRVGKSGRNGELIIVAEGSGGGANDTYAYEWKEGEVISTVDSNIFIIGNLASNVTVTCTVTGTDKTKPVISSVSPSGVDAENDGDIEIVFNEAMSVAEGAEGTVSLNNGDALTGGKWTSDRVYVVPYSGLDYGTTYTISISGFKDIAGNEADGKFSFTTKNQTKPNPDPGPDPNPNPKPNPEPGPGPDPNLTPNPEPSPAPNPVPNPEPTPSPEDAPSADATPAEIGVTLEGVQYRAEKQLDGTYLLVLPPGADSVTDMTALSVVFTLPEGAKVFPANGSPQDFSRGPVTYTITAADGMTITTITVAVKRASSAPTENPLLSNDPKTCEVAYVAHADGTAGASLRIPLDGGEVDGTKIEAMRATISGVTVSRVAYEYVNASGKVIPITAKSVKSASVSPPYLQIAFTARSVDALKKGALDKIEYWLKGDKTEYVQTYAGGLKYRLVPFTDETPKTAEPEDPAPPEDPKDAEEPEGPDAPSGGCDALGTGSLVVLAAAFVLMRRRGK